MKALIAGTGSIGRRHVRSILGLDPTAQFVLLRRDGREDDYSRELRAGVVSGPDEAIAAAPDFAVVATPSALHAELVVRLLEAAIPQYVEKPIVTTRAQLRTVEAALRGAPASTTLCGCNLRFLSSLSRAREMIRAGRIGRVVRASLQVGQWLPDWRPGTDYAASYSASSERGGGVVLDLIHEIDALRWILGEFTRLFALGGHYSSLAVRAEDAAVIGLSRPDGPVVSIGLDYVSRTPIRRYEFVGEAATLSWDLPRRELSLAGAGETQVVALDPDAFDVAATYRAAMREFLAAVAARDATSQDLGEGLKSAELAIRANEVLRS